MSETVFILGAGASQSAGAPLMKDFLDVAERQSKQPSSSREDFELVFDGISALQQAQSKSAIDLNNVESVFAAFEMAKLLGRLGNMELLKINNLAKAMQTVIAQTIGANVNFPISQNQIVAPAPYAQLARLISEATSDTGPLWAAGLASRKLRDFSIITFNYDICLDFAFQNFPVQYCLDWSEHDPDISLQLLKLHGSLNWGTCSECNKIVPVSFAKLFENKFKQLQGKRSVTIPIDFAGGQFEHCLSKPMFGPVVVPPTWNKGPFYENIAPIWREAARQLGDAENIIICGYSYPETDKFFEYLYAIGSIGRVRLKRFWVFNPDVSRERNFRSLLGQGASDRFKFFSLNFEQMLPHVRPIFGLTSN
jgi:hypothetical protein